jgi:hypothetical protein
MRPTENLAREPMTKAAVILAAGLPERFSGKLYRGKYITGIAPEKCDQPKTWPVNP